jgi:S1-C subfamily serine protease
MITRFAEVFSGALLLGALALSGQGSPGRSPAQDSALGSCEQCPAISAQIEGARARVHAALAEVSGRFRAQSAAAEAERAVAAAQRAVTARYQEVTSAFDGTGWLGVRIEEVTGDKTKELQLSAVRGALVTSVGDGSPASKSGLKPNDVITEFNGQRVEGTAALRRFVREVPPGRSVPLTVWRDGRALSLSIEVGNAHATFREDGGLEYRELGPEIADAMEGFNIEIPPLPPMPPMPPMPRVRVGPMVAFRTFGAPLLGIDAEDLSGQLGSYFGAPEGEAVLVREVMPGTPAEKAGMKSGDVITAVDGKRVKTMEDLRSSLRDKAAKSAEGSGEEKPQTRIVSLTVLRKGTEMTLRVELQSAPRRTKVARRVAV